MLTLVKAAHQRRDSGYRVNRASRSHNVVFSAEKCRYSPNRETRVSSNARIVEIKTSNGRLLRLCTACTDLKIALAQSLNVNAITPAFTQQSVQSVTIDVIRFNLAWLNNKFSTANIKQSCDLADKRWKNVATRKLKAAMSEISRVVFLRTI